MSTSRHMDKICVAAVMLSLVLAFLSMNGESVAMVSAGRSMGYENRLFDVSSVHTIDIVMEDWEEFIETCESEEYSPCTVVIDGEGYKNIGVRVDDRPMVGWIFSDESYTQEYHALFSDFIGRWFSDGQLAGLIQETRALLEPYVERDPTRFCTAEEFDAGVRTLEEFVALRAEAVTRQLSGDDLEVDAAGLDLSAMGCMGDTMGGGFGGAGPTDKRLR